MPFYDRAGFNARPPRIAVDVFAGHVDILAYRDQIDIQQSTTSSDHARGEKHLIHLAAIPTIGGVLQRSGGLQDDATHEAEVAERASGDFRTGADDARPLNARDALTRSKLLVVGHHR